ncbi:MAG: A/G-specific adenine glycosylase [Bradymonadia bacterium]|jgi:A/G-specific adenine glycosylase
MTKSIEDNSGIPAFWAHILDEFHVLLCNWFAVNKRDLPWRRDPSPYEVWISEVMLQQTQVNTVIPYYLRWLERFADVYALAEAEESEVFKYWAGLGYYRRAAMLHRAARYIIDHHQGELPNSLPLLRKIPGIGEYTAGAIASFAYQHNCAAVDANVERVLSRLLAFDKDLLNTKNRKQLLLGADYFAQLGEAHLTNQAMMDLGASLCGRSPQCSDCFAQHICQANVRGIAAKVPIKIKRLTRYNEVRGTLAVVSPDGKILMLRRKNRGLLGGLWELPSISFAKTKQGAKQPFIESQSIGNTREDWCALLNHMPIEFDWTTLHRLDNRVKHIFTHIDMEVLLELVHVKRYSETISCRSEDYFEQASFVDLVRAKDLACSSLQLKVLDEILSHRTS